MEFITKIIDIETIFGNVNGYPLSYVELFGTVMGLISVWLSTKANVWTWYTGILNEIAFFLIFYQVQLYADMFLQVYFFAISVIGLIYWYKTESETAKGISYLSRNQRVIIGILVIIGTMLAGYFFSHLHILLPNYFPKAANYPYTDSLIMMLSIAAIHLMAKKVMESWFFWISLDFLCIFVYYQKNVLFIAGEYILFLLISIWGWWEWREIVNGKKTI